MVICVLAVVMCVPAVVMCVLVVVMCLLAVVMCVNMNNEYGNMVESGTSQYLFSVV